MQRFDEITRRQIESNRQSLQKMEEAWGPENRRLIEPLENLSDLLFALGEYSEAEQVSWRILSVATKNFGQDHPAVAGALQMIGEVCEVQGLHLEAERFYLWSLGIRERTKKSDADVAPVVTRLTKLYRTLNQPFKARIMELRLLRALSDQQSKAVAG